MTNTELRLRVQSTVMNWIESLKQENKLPAYMIEDALNKALAKIREEVFVEYILEKQQEEEQAAAQQVQEQKEEQEELSTSAEILD